MKYELLRRKVIEISKKAYSDGLISLTMGNFSIRCNETDEVCITPSGMKYEALDAADIVVIDINGNILDSNKKPSTEILLHLAIYKKRPDVFGIVHTHSVFATSWAACGQSIPVTTAEVGIVLGGAVQCAAYKRPGTIELAETTADFLGNDSAVLMANHGVLAVGKDLDTAYANATTVEEGAKIAFYAKQIGNINILSEEECRILREKNKAEYGQK